MIPRRVRLAVLLAFLCSGFFILTAHYRLSYDAFTHMLFASHYAKDWWSLWDTRWYTGFDIVSYPPLVHQLIALLSPVLGLDAAYAVILWVVVTLYPAGVYSFARIFTGRTAASYAALASSILLPIYVTAFIFGQLPFLTATLLALFTAAALAVYLREGKFFNLILSISLAATTMAAHHATLLVQPFLVLALTIHLLNGQNWKIVLGRLAFFAILVIPAGLLVIWPFWQWGLHQTMQTPIDHLSRHNFFTDPLAQLIFFWPLYGPLVLIIPYVLLKKWPKELLGLRLAFFFLFIIGLGGTTPLPGLLFGRGWEWLTYDRFAFWASLTLTPFFGIILILIKRRHKTDTLLRRFPFLQTRSRILPWTLVLFAVTTSSAWIAPVIFQFQPAPLNMQPIVNFLKEDNRSQWRYLTFGFGDQFAYLNILTSATTIDGSYHTARMLPELRTSGIAQIDTVFWTAKGISALDPILQASSQHGVRWGFVNRREYIPELEKNGWRYLWTLNNGVQIWENPKAVLPEPAQRPPDDPLASFSWGTLPILSLITTAALGSLSIRPIQSEKILKSMHAFLVGLIPIGLCLWYFHPLGEFTYKGVYFIYDSALFFLVDAPAFLAVVLWLAVKVSNRKFSPSNPLTLSFFALCVLASLGIIRAIDWRVSLYVALDLWLIFGLYLSLRDWHASWRPLLIGLCAALVLEVFTGLWEFAGQSTSFLAPLDIFGPSLINSATHNASIVQLPGGETFLRAYGTLPHPNILGGFTLIFLLGPAAFILGERKLSLPAILLFAAGSVLLVLTFSRSAWLGLIVAAACLVWKSKYLARKRLAILGITGLSVLVLMLIPLYKLIQVRVTASSVITEESSIAERNWLAQQALGMIAQRPITGFGVGSFVIELAQHDPPLFEPVHNVPLLIGSELGIPGLLAIIALAFFAAGGIIKANRPEAILLGAALMGLGIICLFDHYFWSLAPGRLAVGLVIGSWAGQMERNGYSG